MKVERGREDGRGGKERRKIKDKSILSFCPQRPLPSQEKQDQIHVHETLRKRSKMRKRIRVSSASYRSQASLFSSLLFSLLPSYSARSLAEGSVFLACLQEFLAAVSVLSPEPDQNQAKKHALLPYILDCLL